MLERCDPGWVKLSFWREGEGEIIQSRSSARQGKRKKKNGTTAWLSGPRQRSSLELVAFCYLFAAIAPTPISESWPQPGVLACCAATVSVGRARGLLPASRHRGMARQRMWAPGKYYWYLVYPLDLVLSTAYSVQYNPYLTMPNCAGDCPGQTARPRQPLTVWASCCCVVALGRHCHITAPSSGAVRRERDCGNRPRNTNPMSPFPAIIIKRAPRGHIYW